MSEGSANGGTPLRREPAIVLIGGDMTLEDGSVVDSRQPVEADPMSKISHAALVGSAPWWTIVASLVEPVLDYRGSDSYALFVGPRSVVEPTPEGKLRRIRARSLLPGRTGIVDLTTFESEASLPEDYIEVRPSAATGEDPAEGAGSEGVDDPYGQARRREEAPDVTAWDRPPPRPDPRPDRRLGVRFRDYGSRWQFFHGNDFYLPQAKNAIHPSVLVSTTIPDLVDTAYLPYYVDYLERMLELSDGLILVLPHTHFAHEAAEAYVRRRNGVMTHLTLPIIAQPGDLPPSWEPRVVSAVTSASFGVTGFVRAGEWQDAGALEAARRLLSARYDLRIGIWDLVDNSTLRSALLEQIEVPEPTMVQAGTPKAAQLRAAQAAARREERRRKVREGIAAGYAHFAELANVGWTRTPRGAVAGWVLDLTEKVQRWQDDKPFPLVRLELSVEAHRTSVAVFGLLYNQLNLPAYARLHEDELTAIKGDAETEFDASRAPVLWRVEGGWGDDPVDWAERAAFLEAATPKWTAVLEEFCEASLRAFEAGVARPVA